MDIDIDIYNIWILKQIDIDGYIINLYIYININFIYG